MRQNGIPLLTRIMISEANRDMERSPTEDRQKNDISRRKTSRESKVIRIEKKLYVICVTRKVIWLEIVNQKTMLPYMKLLRKDNNMNSEYRFFVKKSFNCC